MKRILITLALPVLTVASVSNANSFQYVARVTESDQFEYCAELVCDIVYESGAEFCKDSKEKDKIIFGTVSWLDLQKISELRCIESVDLEALAGPLPRIGRTN